MFITKRSSNSCRFDVQPSDRTVGKGQPVVFQCITVSRAAAKVIRMNQAGNG